ncbi:hypothetical protein RJT34_03116 [Clitoria ternatea]|uniref:Pentatricopeptide repeat-containing protein n=1 Tax=Clitoria ternatea TaxID=43366 RepID=A0AAN9KL55_CLITE
MFVQKLPRVTPVLSKYLPCLCSLQELVNLMKLSANAKNLRLGETIHAQLHIHNQTSKHSDITQINSLINLYSKCGQLGCAREFFDTMPLRNVISWSVLMVSERVQEGMQCHGYLLKSGLLFHQYVKNTLVDVLKDGVTYANVLSFYAQSRDLQLGLQIHAQLLKADLILDVFNGHFEEALNLFTRMVLEGAMPNEYTFAVLLNACTCLAALGYDDLLHARIVKSGYKNHLIVGNALINMYSKSGNIDSSYNVFSNMVYRDVITWNAMICGYSHHGLGKQALLLCQDMIPVGECPNNLHCGLVMKTTQVKWDVVA